MSHIAKFSLVALLASTTLAQAQPSWQKNVNEQRWPLWYVGIAGGVTYMDESDIDGPIAGSADYDSTGGQATIAIGYMPPFTTGYLRNTRIEAEFGYHFTRLDGVTAAGVGSAEDDPLQMLSYMGNVYYDFRNDGQWTPYVGAGAGVSEVSLGRILPFGTNGDNDTVFTYQLMAGLSYAPTMIPDTEFLVGYRYFAPADASFDLVAGGSTEFQDLESHVLEVGGRFKF